LWFYVAAATVVVGAFVATIVYLGPFPPRVVVMSTGAAGGAYDEQAARYQKILARSGIELRLLPSAGAAENLKRLNDPASGVSVGFIQGGLAEKPSPDLASLGTISVEPIWLFYRGAPPGPHFEGFRNRKISIGPEGSGSHGIALEWLARNGFGPGAATLLPLPLGETGDQLEAGKIDAALMVAAWEAPVVRRLLADPQIELATFPRARAYAALYRFLHRVTLPAGIGSLSADRPPADVTLLATKSSLIVRGDLHPAIQYLLLDAATEVHSAGGIFQNPGDFPAAEQFDVPLSSEARQFYKSGRPFLQRYLPFWLAVFAGRLLVLLIPLLGVAYPLLRLVPSIYGWSMRRRIFKLYAELMLIEVAVEKRPGTNRADLLAQLNHLDERANHLKVPLGFADLHYTLREHISLVRANLERRAIPAPHSLHAGSRCE
jgi:TRAP-type uncharacterized transport system substrate-binding protein